MAAASPSEANAPQPTQNPIQRMLMICGCGVVDSHLSLFIFEFRQLSHIPSAISVNGGFRMKNLVDYAVHIIRKREVVGYSLQKYDIAVVDEGNSFDTDSLDYPSCKPVPKVALQYSKVVDVI